MALAYLGLGLAIVLAWANVLGGGPVFDDHFLVVQNTCFKSMAGLWRILSLDPAEECAYRPLRYLSYGVDRLVLGDHFWAYHLGNVLRHVLAAWVAGAVATRLFSESRDDEEADGASQIAVWAGFAVAALWALHPVQTDSVSYVSGRRDILAGTWVLVALGTALVARRRGGLWWLLPLWATVLGFMSKESAVVIPALFFAWVARGESVGAWLRAHKGVLVAGVLGLVMSSLAVWRFGVLASRSHRGLFEWWGGSAASNFATVAALQLRYLGHGLGVSPLIGDYHAETIPLAEGFGDLRALAGVALVVLLTGLSLRLWTRRPVVSFGLAMWLVALTPVSHVIPHHELYAEHYLYVPIFGLMLAAVDGALWLTEASDRPQGLRRVMVVLLGAVVALMAARVAWRNLDWRDERTFYESVLAQAPQNQRALGNLLYIYAEQQAWDDAVAACTVMAPMWQAGAGQERQALMVCTDAARQAGDGEALAAFALQLAEHHPQIGRGHRLVAELALGRGAYAAAHASALRWYELTRDPVALEVAARAVTSGAEVPRSAFDEVVAIATSASESTEATRALLAQALAGSMRGAEGYALLVGRATGREREAYTVLRCAIWSTLEPRPADAVCGGGPAEGSGEAVEGSGAGQ